jgi:hypothetical protein
MEVLLLYEKAECVSGLPWPGIVIKTTALVQPSKVVAEIKNTLSEIRTTKAASPRFGACLIPQPKT